MILLFSIDGCSQHKALIEGLTESGCEVQDKPVSVLDSMPDTRQIVSELRPSCIIVEPPFRRVDKAEAESDEVFRVNCENLLNAGVAALEFGCKIILLSTAEVFGQRGGPWIEGDEPQPKSSLAESILRAEQLLSRLKANVLIVRTSVRLPDSQLDLAALSSIPPKALVGPILSRDLGLLIPSFIERDLKGLIHVPSAEAPVKKDEFFGEIQGLTHDDRRVRQSKSSALYATHAILDSVKLQDSERAKISSWRGALPTLSSKVVVSSQQENTMSVVTSARRVDKPWGHEIIWAHTEKYVGKILFVKAGERLSLQYHEVKDETIYVLSGKMVFEVGERDKEREDLIMKAGDSYRIRPFTVHRMIAVEDTQILEASTPELNDVVRLEDSYGREGTSAP